MKIARVFFDFDMRCNFEGIKELLKKEKMKDEETKDMVVILLNRATTSFKLLIDNSYIVYYKNGHRRIPLDALQFLPQRFGGSEMEFNRAVERSLREKLKLKNSTGQVRVVRKKKTETTEARA